MDYSTHPNSIWWQMILEMWTCISPIIPERVQVMLPQLSCFPMCQASLKASLCSLEIRGHSSLFPIVWWARQWSPRSWCNAPSPTSLKWRSKPALTWQSSKGPTDRFWNWGKDPIFPQIISSLCQLTLSGKNRTKIHGRFPGDTLIQTVPCFILIWRPNAVTMETNLFNSRPQIWLQTWTMFHIRIIVQDYFQQKL